MKKKRNSLSYSLVLFLVAISHASESSPPRRGLLMSAPLDLLSESLASSSSLINQLMLRQNRDERGYGGPMASALLSKQSGKFQPFRRRRQTTTTGTTTTEKPTTRETLVYACPEPEGCPPPVLGQKYEPVRISNPSRDAEKPRDVLDTIYRQEVVKNKKVMRVRKKQRKPNKKEEEALPMKAVKMVSEMIKEAGPVLTQQEVEIIADVSQEVGAKVNEKQVKVISVLSEAMGPVLSVQELNTIAEVASTVEEDATLASDSTLEVVAEMVKSKVGRDMSKQELEQIKDIMTKDEVAPSAPTGQDDAEVKQSGLTDHAAQMITQMMNNIGSNASPAEVKIVADMIKELDKDVPKETAEVMAQVLVEMMPKVSTELVHNVSAIMTNDPPNLDAEDVEMVADVVRQSPPLSQEVTPEVVQMVAEMAVEEQMDDVSVMKMVERQTDVTLEMSDIETIKEVTQALMEEHQGLDEADLEVVSLMSKLTAADEPSTSFESVALRPQGTMEKKEEISKNEAQFLSDVVKLFGERVTPTERAELEVEVKKADPTMNENQAEVMTQLLVDMGPEIEPKEIMKMAEMVTDPSLDLRADNVKEVSQTVSQVEAEVQPDEVKTIANMMNKMGPNLSMREMHMITRMVGIKENDVARIAMVVNELGPIVSETEAELISMMTKAHKDASETLFREDVGMEVAKVLKTMGEAVTTMEKKKIAEVVTNVTKNVDEEKAEIVAEVISEAGPNVPAEKIEKLTEAVNEANSIDTVEKVKKVMMVLEKAAEPIKAEDIEMVTKLMDRMAGIGPMTPSKMAQVANIGKQLGVDVTPQEVEAVHSIEEAAENSITKEDAELVETISEILSEESDDGKDINLEEATHLADVVNSLDTAVADQKAKVVMAMVKDQAPAIDAEKVEVMAQVLAEVGSNLKPENVTEVAKLITDDKTSDVSVEDIKEMATMARKMSKAVTMEQVTVIAEVKAESGSRMDFREMKLATDLANQLQSDDANEVLPTDVQIVMQMIDIIKADENDDKEELIAIMTKAAEQDVFSPDSSTRFTSGVPHSDEKEMSDREAEEIKEMVEKMVDNGSFNDAREESIIVNEIMHMEANMDQETAKTAVKVMETLENLDASMVKKVIEMVKDPEVDIKSEDVEKIAEKTKELPKDISPMDVIVVANLAARMGPVLTNREADMVARLAASSGVAVDKEEVQILNEVANEIGSNVSDGEAEIIALVANEGKKEATEDGGEVINDKDAAKVADVVQGMGSFMSTDEVVELKQMIEDKAPKLDSKEVAVVTEVLSQVGPEVVDGDLVKKVAEAADESSDKITPHAIDMIVDAAKKVEAKITPKDMEVVVELIEKSGTNISPREMQMIQRMTKKANINVTREDVKLVEEMVNMLGRDLSTKDIELMAVIVEEVQKKEENMNADELMKTLEALDGRKVGLGEVQLLENVIEEMEPLMTKSKVQVMSQVLLESSVDKLEKSDVKELAEIIMQASDDITPGDVEEIAEMVRKGDEPLTEKEVKIVADMSSKFGESLSQREVQMIARMMRSSGLTMTLNDIVMVAEVAKMKDKEVSDNDAKLIAKMTEVVDDTPKASNIFTTTAKPFVRISMLPKKPTISTLPDRPVPLSPRPPRIKMNMQLQNRPPPRKYIPTEEPAVDTNDGDFGKRRKPPRVMMRPRPSMDNAPPAPTPSEEMTKTIMQFPSFDRSPIKPTLDTLMTTTDAFDMDIPEQSTQIKLEEFLMRNRPTPFRTFPSEDPPEEEEFQLAVKPTEVTEDDFVRMPGDSFMQITMGQSSFGDKQNLVVSEAPVSRDTLKSVAENFAFANNEPQGMLMNFLLKKKLPLMQPTTTAAPPMMMPTTTPMPMIWQEMMTQDPLMNLFDLESTTLDRSKNGNFIHMKMGKNEPSGVDPSVIPKLEKTRISLNPDGNSFMSMQMGDMINERISERMSTMVDHEENLVDLKRPVRKIPGHPSDPWPNEVKTPFTMRPTLPVGQATIWPQQTPGRTPFTARPSLKPFVHLGGITTTTPFTVRPTRRPVKGNYIHNSAYGKGGLKKPQSYVHHDVKLKDPLATSGVSGYTRQKVRPNDNFHTLQDGYTGIGSLSHPGMHDDRPPYSLGKPDSSLKATFGGLKFNLPDNGLPDIPDIPAGDQSQFLRDLPDIDQLNYEDEVDSSASDQPPSYQFAKSYLKNPYGADFIRLEIDSNRYKHNKTRRLGGIHHIPLKIHGYAETSEYPVSTDTERPMKSSPPKMQHHRPKKQISIESGDSAEGMPFQAVRDAMENIPNAIQSLPNLMQSLVSNHASWMDKVWPSSDDKSGATDKASSGAKDN